VGATGGGVVATVRCLAHSSPKILGWAHNGRESCYMKNEDKAVEERSNDFLSLWDDDWC
jgi:hypothetical protein